MLFQHRDTQGYTWSLPIFEIDQTIYKFENAKCRNQGVIIKGIEQKYADYNLYSKESLMKLKGFTRVLLLRRKHGGGTGGIRKTAKTSSVNNSSLPTWEGPK